MHIEKRKSGLLKITDREDGIRARGVYRLQHIRGGKVIGEEELKNLVVDQGLNYVLGVSRGAASQITSWSLGLFHGNYTPVASDTAATIAPNSTENNSYNGGTRLAWTPGAVAAKSVSNTAARADFVFNAPATIYGAFLCSSATINGTNGTLFSAEQVVNLDELLLTYTFAASTA